MRGKLVDRYHNQRKKLKKSGVLTTACPSSSLEVHETVEIASSQDYEDDVEDFCCWLRYNTEPWPEVLAKWKATTCVRIPRYNQNTTTTIQEYFQEYKILEKSLGYQLLEIDFNYLYPKKSEIFFAEIHKKKHIILRLAQYRGVLTQHFPDQNINILNEDATAVLSLLTLPYLMPVVIVTTNKKKWKPSKVEVANSFITYVKTSEEMQLMLERRHRKYAETKQLCQPLITIVGPDFNNLKGYISIDNCTYPFESALKKYPPECSHVWQLIQIYIYDLKTEWDKKSSIVSALISDLCNESESEK
ncbi:uncharacterized protein LOC135135583 [Zophobas morio]|uniref:uncharacterized protein LOC135135583 n=1 Tax=Zophobas morio TaxID=2755281 RepID=UPI0030828033